MRNSVSVMVATMLFSGVLPGFAMAATHTVPSSVEHPMPLQPTLALAQPRTATQTHQMHLAASAPSHAPIQVSTQVSTHASAPVSTPTPAPTSTPATKQVATTPTPAKVYADTPPAQVPVGQPADVNTNIPYASVLPKDAEIVPGAPGKNEFFIVAAEDAAKIKQLLDHTKPGREVMAGDIKSKQPIVKVKLDESNSTLVSMDVVASVSEVAKAAVKPSVRMTDTDEVMTIFTKNKITPVGSRVVAAAPSLKTKPVPNEVDQKPMLKLLALTDPAHGSDTQTAVPKNIINPLETTAAVRPIKGTMPDTVAMKQTIQQPESKPVALPPASKEATPTLEMILQQAKSGGDKKGDDKIKSKAAIAFANAILAADVKLKKEKLKEEVVAKPAKLGVKSVSKPAAKLVAKPVSKPATQLVAKSVSKPATKLVAKTVSKPVAKLVAKPGSKTATTTKLVAIKPVNKPATKSLVKSPVKKVVTKVKKLKKTMAVAGKVILYEDIKTETKQAKPVVKAVTKKGPWGARHAASAPKTKKVASKKLDNGTSRAT